MGTRDMSLAGKQSCKKCGSTDINFGGGGPSGYSLDKCNGCGKIEPDFIVSPDPCWICENENPTIKWAMTDGWGGHFEGYTGIPGVPSSLNLCECCTEKAENEIDEIMADLFADGWDGSC